MLHQRWENLLFLHWPIYPGVVRPLIPPSLELDLFEGQAWIGITPFHVDHMTPAGLPRVPGLRAFEEIHVRTYVKHQDRPGIWFFSLDASKVIPALAARTLFLLNYHKASIEFTVRGDRFGFAHRRRSGPAAEFAASWRAGGPLPSPGVDSLEFFLVERYCAFTVDEGRVNQIRIYHAPWSLREVSVELHGSSLIAAQGIPEPVSEPLAHFTEPVNADIWPLKVAKAPATEGTVVRVE